MTARPESRDDRPTVPERGDPIEIVSMVSHELRSPLAAMKGLTTLLMSRWDQLDDDQKLSMLRAVHDEAERVGRMVTELLDVSRLELGRTELRRRRVDLASLARSVVDRVALEWPDLDASITVPDGFPTVYADPDKVQQVLTNLVENACKYGSPRGLVIAGTVSEADRRVTMSVRDQGPGIAPADLPHVFEQFFRRPGGKPTGIGLGLWICRGLVEAHGGEMDVESSPGGGATFRFSLPTDALDELEEP